MTEKYVEFLILLSYSGHSSFELGKNRIGVIMSQNGHHNDNSNRRVCQTCSFWAESQAKYLGIEIKDSWDQQLPSLIVYGFPFDFYRSMKVTSTFENHASANKHAQHIDQYIAEELKYGVLYT